MSSAPMNIFSKWACVMVFAILCAAGIRAQEISASIRGTVTDGSGGAVNGAKVTAINTDTGLQRTAVTNSQGVYVLVELPVGPYRVETEAQGFKKYIQEGISLDVNQQATVAVHLAVGTATQQIQVTSDALIIETTSTNLGQTVGEREILDLPLNGRDFTQLGLLQTGVVPLTPGLLEAGGPAREGQAYAVNGQRPESNNFLIDGADNFDTVDGGLVMKPPIDAIAEFRILTHTANAEFGHSTGSTTNIITHSGTNDYHGTVWDFFRNNPMDAKSFFADSVEPLHRNQFGGVFGGPIKKDKTFFFVYYEGVRDTQGETTRATVPSDAERTGNFADQCPLNNGPFNAQGLCIDNSTGQLSQNGQLINEFSGQPIPYNQLPFINPISKTLLSYYPLANSGPFTYVGTQSLSSNTNQFGVRVDHYLTSRDT
ncbi:MAG: carboxypeptidase-like regulatory domain-containing protein [Candidatus Acidiferrum sp.]